jgi:hypothetical protein
MNVLALIWKALWERIIPACCHCSNTASNDEESLPEIIAISGSHEYIAQMEIHSQSGKKTI